MDRRRKSPLGHALRGDGMPDRIEIGGSPHPDPCANMESGETATISSAPDEISAPEGFTSHTSGSVPLYLMDQAMSTEIHEHGDTIVEVRIRRTRNHHYLITLVTGKEEGEAHAAGGRAPGKRPPPF